MRKKKKKRRWWSSPECPRCRRESGAPAGWESVRTAGRS